MTRWLLGMLLLAISVPGSAAEKRPRERDTLRFPYVEGALYRVRLVPGSPFVVELPEGEAARNIWRDTQYWMAETTPGSSRVVIRPIAASDVIGRKGFIHIETAPSQLRISLQVEAVEDLRGVPAALRIYLEGAPRPGACNDRCGRP